MTPADRRAPTRPLVSVIIPAHDAGEYLHETISSALAQSYTPLEVVVVNDGSTDDTAGVARAFGDRIVYADRENGGPAAARNTALGLATGSMIALLDADDRWQPNRIERCVEILEHRPEIGMVTTDAFLIEDDVPTTKRAYVDRRRYPFPAREEDQLDEIARRNFLFVGVVFRSELIDRCGGFDERIWGAEDYDLWTRFLLTDTRAAFINEPLGWYRRRTGSVSASPQQWGEHLFVLEKHLPELWRRGARGRARDAYDIAELLAARGDRRQAAQFFRRAVVGEEASPTQRMKLAGGAIRNLIAPGHPTPTAQSERHHGDPVTAVHRG